MAPKHKTKGSISRRQFLVSGGAVAAVGGLPSFSSGDEPDGTQRIKSFRTLGRTGFKVSDISIGGSGEEANLYRYAYDHGINYIDTAEGYSNGDNERKIGEALQHMDREKVFITTKMVIKDEDTEQSILDRFGKCQERLRTDYVNALYMHSVRKVELLDNAGFHAAVKRLKADGRLRHAGLSSHGPEGDEDESMSKVLCAAAADGRFDLMLLRYNFMNSEEGDEVLAVCKEHNVGTTAMKTAPGSVEIEAFDPKNPAERWAKFIKRRMDRGDSREDAEKEIREWIAEQEEVVEKTRPFMEEHGISTKSDLRAVAVKWVLSNPDMHTVCIRFRDFDTIDRFVPLSGTKLARNEAAALDRYRVACSSRYCRHGCIDCAGSCPHDVPVSTVMRYAYYFSEQGQEKLAMSKYSGLNGRDGTACTGCRGPCAGACPHGVNIQANLLTAHDLLTLA